jgi:GrpB-like predicted nucleotidyltransferase (UPF0157 family)
VERKRLLKAFGGFATEGGVLYGIEHVGSTSVPGLAAKPCIDITLTLHPFPLTPEQIVAVAALGYEYRSEYGIPRREYFQRGPHRFHLHAFDAGDWRFDDHKVLRDYLRVSPDARARYQALKENLAQRCRDDRVAYT